MNAETDACNRESAKKTDAALCTAGRKPMEVEADAIQDDQQ
jgi:hypothetical protein